MRIIEVRVANSSHAKQKPKFGMQYTDRANQTLQGLKTPSESNEAGCLISQKLGKITKIQNLKKTVDTLLNDAYVFVINPRGIEIQAEVLKLTESSVKVVDRSAKWSGDVRSARALNALLVLYTRLEKKAVGIFI